MKVFITGVSGQLGYEVAEVLKKRKIEYRGVTSKKLDITDRAAVFAALEAYRPDAVIHCAAYTKVDAAEDDAEECRRVNVQGTENIAEACRAVGAKMLYVSTDYVFSGEGTDAYETDSPTAPQNVYGRTKLDGELAVKHCLTRYFIVRTSWVIGAHGGNFVKTMLHLAESHSELRVVADQIGSPTFTFDLAPLLCDMVMTEQYGVYHATNGGCCSWAELAEEIFADADKAVIVHRVTTEQYGAKARRPKNSRLSKASLVKNQFPLLPDWKASLKLFLKNTDGER